MGTFLELQKLVYVKLNEIKSPLHSTLDVGTMENGLNRKER